MNTEEVWRSFYSPLRNFIIKRIKNDHDADDILQNVFMKIHANLDTLKDDQKLQSWIYQITRNSIIDYFRKEQSHLKTDLPHEFPIYQDEEMNDAIKELSACIRPMIQGLSDKFKQALELTELGDCTQKELSVQLGLSISGAKSRVQRGREKLKELLLNCCNFEFDRLGNIIDYTSRGTSNTKCSSSDCC
ncbi:RNA polymerase sigma factor SigZ [Paenibacillus sp. CGMCC 1.16610]|uniref:RNA polymerase sigma factor SigZ n=1 Tax=Paenibacillus anseongense TaxID=2682845 RepID=A0ABW9UK83_9BACL|nr:MULTISPECIES: RNA polymerase sigma factor SigZ [Paenibacillus]MBA2939751.1 RNA polymerase sigma factor SigZ [Paenibacillus sp. CGMCC 1.16610]MVQ39411.1 RNA polymerase sigma factor SigZ [Paenibacillus anseongense]